MQFGENSKILTFGCLFLLILSNFACAQSEAEKAKLHNKFASRASELRSQDDLQAAIEEQKKAVEIYPNDANTLSVLAGMYLDFHEKNKSKESLNKAQALLKQAVNIAPNDAVIRQMYSLSLELSGDNQGALREMKTAVKLQPDNLDNLVNLAAIEQSLKNTDSARKNLDEVLQQNSKYIYALYRYGEIELEEGNIETAKEFFQKVVSQKSNANNRDLTYIAESEKRLEELGNQKSKAATESAKLKRHSKSAK